MPKPVIITGIKAIDRRLGTLEPRLQRKVLGQSIRAGMKVLLAEVKARISVLTGAMRAAVQLRVLKRRRRGSIEMEVRIAGNWRTVKQSPVTGKRAFYPAIVEYGDRDNPPQAPMRGSLDSKGEAARQVTIRHLRDGVEREARR